MKRRTLLLGGAAIIAAAASSSASRAAPPPVQVIIDKHAFGPAEIEVPVGTEVEWLNRDGDEHDVTEKDKKFKSPIIDTGESFKRTFSEPGVVDYYCSLHPHMIGKVKVVG